MTQPIRISHKEIHKIDKWRAEGETNKTQEEILSYLSPEMESPGLSSCTASFSEPRNFNSIYIHIHEDYPELFPDTFRIEISGDGEIWEPIIRETNFHSRNLTYFSAYFPLISARHIKFVSLMDRKDGDGNFRSAFGQFQVGISGVTGLEVSGELDRLWVKENLFDERKDYGWSTPLKSRREDEHVFIDLGSINRVAEIRLLSKDDVEPFFPQSFRVSFSEDNISWHHLFEENSFLAEGGCWYKWRLIPQNMRFIKFSITEGARTREGKYISQIIEIELYAHSDSLEDKNIRATPMQVPYASVLRSGIVRLGMDGEVAEGVVVQANDRRLRDASTEGKGIVELGVDGEDRPGVVVQGNDRRLKMATEDLPGIVRLARDGEVRSGHVVQSNDSRLAFASEEAMGLVELASDGEDKGGVAVQGNDRRLRSATVNSPGIVKLAENLSDRPGEAVQGNDHRLRDATTEYKGLVRFARDGENSPNAAVQGSDPRLRMATTETPGIVELARNGESSAGKVVQGDDERLKPASEHNAGILALNPPGGILPGHAIQGNDPRLSDARPPAPHTHDYAPGDHSYDSHSGSIRLSQSLGRSYKSIATPPIHYSPITGINEGEGAGITGTGKNEGVLGSAEGEGVVGYSIGKGSGILGASRKGPGGRFHSERSFAIIAGGHLEERGIESSPFGLLVNGVSVLNDTLYFPSESAGFAPVIAYFFPVDGGDIFVPGNIVITTENTGKLKKSRETSSPNVIGVVVEKAAIILNMPEGLLNEATGEYHKPAGYELIATTGIVEVDVLVENGSIRPGDYLRTSIESGRAEKASQEDVRNRTIFARSLAGHSDGPGRIRALLL